MKRSPPVPLTAEQKAELLRLEIVMAAYRASRWRIGGPPQEEAPASLKAKIQEAEQEAEQHAKRRGLEKMVGPYDRTMDRLSGLAIGVTIGFLWSMLVLLLTLWWFLYPGEVVYEFCIFSFFILLGGLVVLGVLVSRALLSSTRQFG